MAGYAATGLGTAGSNKAALSLTGGSGILGKLYYFAISCGAAVADAAGIFEVLRHTAPGTNTSVTPEKLDPSTRAADVTSGENHSAQPTLTSGSELISLGINQRNTVQWWAPDLDSALIIPATANNGLTFRSLSHTGTPQFDATAHWKE